LLGKMGLLEKSQTCSLKHFHKENKEGK